MLKNISICLWSIFLILFPSVPVYAGELEQLEEDIRFLYQKYDYAIRAGLSDTMNPETRTDYVKRMQMAEDRAFRIQQKAASLGIRNITLQKEVADMFRFMKISFQNTSSLDRTGNRGSHYTEVMRQINLLKKLKFNYENGTFTRLENEGAGTEDALKVLEQHLTACEKLFQNKKIQSEESMRMYKKNHLQVVEDLTGRIASEVLRRRITMPEEFNLYGHVRSFSRAYDEFCREMEKQRKADFIARRRKKQKDPYRKPGAAQKTTALKENAVLRQIQEKQELAFSNIKQDLKILRDNGYSLRIGRESLYHPARRTSPVSESAPMPVQQDFSRSPASLYLSYEQRLKEAFASESRINGVSQEYYDNFRKNLPPRIARELDREYRRQLDRKMHPDLARSQSVLAIYSQYRKVSKAYTQSDLKFIQNLMRNP